MSEFITRTEMQMMDMSEEEAMLAHPEVWWPVLEKRPVLDENGIVIGFNLRTPKVMVVFMDPGAELRFVYRVHGNRPAPHAGLVEITTCSHLRTPSGLCTVCEDTI